MCIKAINILDLTTGRWQRRFSSDGTCQPVSPLSQPTQVTAMKRISRFLKSEDGPTAVEYAIMLALIVVVCLGAIQTVGTNAKSTFTNASAQL
jgi:pilus assembly protein Flp/PilA